MNILDLARHGLNNFEQISILAVLIVAFISLIYAWLLRGTVLNKDKGSEKMQEVWEAIRIGADSYLRRQLKTILPAIGILFLALFLSVYVVPPSHEALLEFPPEKYNTQLIISIGRAVAFVLGASFSLIVGQLGMRMAIQASVRAASAARRSFNESLTIAYYAGTITGMLTDGLGLLGGTVIFIIFGKASPDALLGFGFGGTLLALFMRVGGGIYTKAADVGADLVGKVEKDIPEDDPRNAAVVADLVGDNVGDCAGMAADIFESYEVTIVSALILGIALWSQDPVNGLKWIVYPLIIRGIGVLSSILGTFTVPIWEKFPLRFLRAHDAEEAMFRSYEVSSVNTIVWSFVVAIVYAHDWKLAMLTTIGVGLAIAFNPLTSYFTSTKSAPVKEIVESTKFGPATTILSGLGLGMESSVWALCVIAASFVAALLLYGGMDKLYVLYGVAMVGIGMLSHTGNNVAMDSYGPISDNANGIGEMSWHDLKDEETKKARQIMADLDAVGNTTKAITKGIAIASAVIAAVSLFSSYITDVSRVQMSLIESGIKTEVLDAIRVSDTKVFVGFLLGGALPWLFSSLSIKAVTRAAGKIVEEVRRQFRIPGIMEGSKKPDYAQVVSISTASAQKELIPLAAISVLIPLIVGLVLQVEALGGFLAGVILSGQLLAVFMANSGGAWDNAKKTIEDEPRNIAENTGKGSERHKAGVVGDTVGDPLKDTAGPALNPMIKVVNLVSLLAAPVIVRVQHLGFVGWAVVVVLLAAVVWAISVSKKAVIIK
ncbi:MAG TPA: sodium-translocating pyrophosphatase [Anaerolineaceae bacterium]|jgi:K(+)-stimulated pyrophosphate-energized sodium pump|nr:sodium-translocating pyrophosphatase [Anaerolineaceae bacterium]HOE02677.1 sodium-translocating pyrophosphatase [Anaerolineaceae bacterium]HPD62546.1 sodium-translocating pyrophosphatase [Anaerolineaceae bacterium]HUM62205.1 sodium-translocating pyrophosphatase [Anaerolineaceae bacterium]